MVTTRKVNGTYVRNDPRPGKRIGEWLVLREARKGEHKGYICRCSCGIEKFVQGVNLITGASSRCISCGAQKHRLHQVGDKVGNKTILAFLPGRGKYVRLVRCKCGWLGEQDSYQVGRGNHIGCPLTVRQRHAMKRLQRKG